MADKYSTVHQREPIRVPSGWNAQEKHLIVQLEEIFDDIYRRYGRLRIEDMGDRLRKIFGDVNDRYAEIVIEEGGISASLYNKYTRVSGIDITNTGVTITGNKFVKINVNQIQDWVFNEIGFSLRLEGDSRFNKGFWIGERNPNNVELSRTSINYNQKIYPFSWGNGKSNEIELTHTSEIFGEDSYQWHTLTWGTGAYDDTVESPSLYPNSDSLAILGDVDHSFAGIYSTMYFGFNITGDLGRLNLVPTSKDINTRLQIVTDNQYLRVKKGGSSNKKVLFEGDITGGSGLTTSATDFNNIESTGDYWITLSTVTGHKPSGLTTGTVLLEVFNSGASIIQKFYYTYGELYIRQKIGTNWYSWYKFTGTAV